MKKFEIIWFDLKTDLKIRCKLEAETGEEAMQKMRKAVGYPDPFACAIVDLEETDEFNQAMAKRREEEWEKVDQSMSPHDLFMAGAEYERQFNNQ